MSAGVDADDDVKRMIIDIVSRHDHQSADWILASAGGVTKVHGKTKKQWLRDLRAQWPFETRTVEAKGGKGYLYVAFQIFTPVGREKDKGVASAYEYWKEKDGGIKLLESLDSYGITYGAIVSHQASRGFFLGMTDPDDLMSR